MIKFLQFVGDEHLTYECRPNDAPEHGNIRALIGSGSSWSFEIFREANRLPVEVQKQIIKDCEKIANEPGESILAARASFQLGLASVTGFGTSVDIDKALSWFERSANQGFRLPLIYMPVLEVLSRKCPSSHDECLQRYEECNLRAFRAKHLSTMVDIVGEAANEGIESVEKAILQKLTLASGTEDLSEDSSAHLSLASRLGLTRPSQELCIAGADVAAKDSQGCTPLHWLFLYPPEAMTEIARLLAGHTDTVLFPSSDSLFEGSSEKIAFTSTLNGATSMYFSQQLDPQLPLRLIGTPLAFAGKPLFIQFYL